MAVVFELPEDIELHLRRELGDLAEAAKEAAVVELYRQGKISQPDLGRALGLSRLEVEALLKRRGVTEDLPTDAEYAVALARLEATRP
jgi:predicted HTH domain antitoxin